MLKALRRNLNPSMVVAVAALVLAMGGGAYAAKKYVITSTKQIKPSVLKSLQGKSGVAGSTGPAGSSGKDGTNGKDGSNGNDGSNGVDGTDGSPWTAGGTLPSGATETGSWAFAETEAFKPTPWQPISFMIPLEGPLGPSGVHYLAEGEGEKAECPGTAEEPEAAEGNLCVYTTELGGQSLGPPVINQSGVRGQEEGASPTGAWINFQLAETETFGYGTWAVTAE
jgi:hypothetical protein